MVSWPDIPPAGGRGRCSTSSPTIQTRSDTPRRAPRRCPRRGLRWNGRENPQLQLAAKTRATRSSAWSAWRQSAESRHATQGQGGAAKCRARRHSAQRRVHVGPRDARLQQQPESKPSGPAAPTRHQTPGSASKWGCERGTGGYAHDCTPTGLLHRSVGASLAKERRTNACAHTLDSLWVFPFFGAPGPPPIVLCCCCLFHFNITAQCAPHRYRCLRVTHAACASPTDGCPLADWSIEAAARPSPPPPAPRSLTAPPPDAHTTPQPPHPLTDPRNPKRTAARARPPPETAVPPLRH